MLTTPGGWLLLLAVLAPFVGVLVGLALGGRNAQRVATLILPIGLAVALLLRLFDETGSVTLSSDAPARTGHDTDAH